MKPKALIIAFLTAIASQIALAEGDADTSSIVKTEQPIYSALSKQDKEQGTVTLRVLVLVSGKVANAEVIQSSGYPRLDESAKAAVMTWQFKTVRVNKYGDAMNWYTTVPVTFKLE